jgi:hypothetical protein
MAGVPAVKGDVVDVLSNLTLAKSRRNMAGIPGWWGSEGDHQDGYFLTTFAGLWTHLIIWTMLGCALGFFGAGVLSCRVNQMGHHKWLWIPWLMLLFGAAVGFVEGCIIAAIVAAMYSSIAYEVGLDVATGLGLGQATIIMYCHLGRADFVHS